MRPLVGCSKPAIIRSVVVLPQPDGPSIEKNSPLADGEVGLVYGDEAAEALGDVLEVDDRIPADRRLSLHRAPAIETGSVAPTRGQLTLDMPIARMIHRFPVRAAATDPKKFALI